MPNFSALWMSRPRLGNSPTQAGLRGKPSHRAGQATCGSAGQAHASRQAGQAPSSRQAGQASSSRQDGQAIVEYILALAIIITVVTIVSSGFRHSLFRLWEFYGKQISAPCPGCPADPAVRLR